MWPWSSHFLSESSFLVSEMGPRHRDRPWQNPHQQLLKERKASCNKGSVYWRHNSHCHSMPVLAYCLRPGSPSGMPGNCGPLLTCPEACWETHLGTSVLLEGQSLGGPVDAASWGRGFWYPLGPGTGRWSWAVAGGRRPRVRTLGTLGIRQDSLALSPSCSVGGSKEEEVPSGGMGRDQGMWFDACLPPSATRRPRGPCTYPSVKAVLRLSFLLPLPVLW